MQPLSERYRPQFWDDVVGQRRVVRTIGRHRAENSVGGRAYWLAGPSGTGKTTIAKLLAFELSNVWGIEEMDAGELTLPEIRRIETSLCYRAFANELDPKRRTGKAIIVNEAHGLRKDTVRRLLSTLEEIPPWAVWIFTTTDAGQLTLFDGIDSHPLVTRCTQLAMDDSQESLEARAKAVQIIAKTEQLDGRPLTDYVALLAKCKGSMREALQRVDAGEMLP